MLTESHNKKWLYWVLDCLGNIRTHPGTQFRVPKEILPWGTQLTNFAFESDEFFYWQNSVAVFHYHYWCHVALHYMRFIWKYIWLQHRSFISKTFIWYLLKSSNTFFNSSSALPFALSPSHMSDECMCMTLKNFPFRINCHFVINRPLSVLFPDTASKVLKTYNADVHFPMCHGDIWGSGGMAPLIVNLNTRWKWLDMGVWSNSS